MAKNTSVSARTPSDVTDRLDAMGICISDLINKALFKASMNIATLKNVILKKESELDDLKYLLKKMELEERNKSKELKKFFKETKIILNNNHHMIDGRIKLFYKLFSIPVNEKEFMEMMEKYTR
jgi:hypothetical protein